MHIPSLLALLGAAAVVAILHSILPDHWVPLAIVARTQRWSLFHVGRVTFLASLGHVITSIILAGIIAIIGLQFQQQLEVQQGHIVGGILILTGLGFLIWGFSGHDLHGHSHDETHNHEHESEHEHDYDEHIHESEHEHDHDEHTHESEHTHDHEEYDHSHEHDSDHKASKTPSLAKRLAAIAVPFGVAASPDLTILPVALAASAVSTGAVVGVLSVFTVLTILSFLVLTLVATQVGYQIKGAWLEKNANTITSLVLVVFGIVAFVGF